MYSLIVLVIVAAGAVWGFRKGLACQTPGVLGVAFGIITTRIMQQPVAEAISEAIPSAHGSVGEVFIYQAVANALIFTVVYLIFATITGFLSRVLSSRDRSILDNIAGGVFALFKYLLFMSVAYNFLAAVNLNPDSPLVRCARSDDGNVVEETMLLAPALLGGEDVEDLSHKIQLEEAKKIS